MSENTAEFETTPAEPNKPYVLDYGGKARESYLQRRVFVEQEFRKKGEPKQDRIEMEEGAIVNVFSSFVEIPESTEIAESGVKRTVELKKDDDEYNLTIFVPGLFQADKPNYGNHPLEIKLAGSLLRQKTDAVMMLKAEGLNEPAYQDEKGKGKVQTTVSKAALNILRKTLQERGLIDQDGKPIKKIKFSVAGYSEGSTQGASIAARLVESELGEVVEFVSIGGAGLVGAVKQSDVDLIQFFKHAQEAKKGLYVLEKDGTRPDTLFIEGRLLGNKILHKEPDEKDPEKIRVQELVEGLEGSLGKARVGGLADVRNVGIWGIRLLASELGLVEQVPRARLNAAATINHDYDTLVEKGIPLIIFSPTQEIFFPNIDVRKRVGELRADFPNSKVVLVSSNVGHDFPHHNPSGTAYAIELAKEKAHLN